MELSKASIKESIVYILEEKGNHSCLEKNLLKDVLRFLAIPLRGREREEFHRKVKVASGQLKRAKIIESYQTSVNLRVRLTKNYEKAFERLQKTWLRQQGTPENTPSSDSTLSDIAGNGQRLLFQPKSISGSVIAGGGIPDIPELDTEEETDYQDEHHEEEFDHEEDTLHKLDILTNHDSTEGAPTNGESRTDVVKPSDLPSNILDSISDRLVSTSGISVERSFDELTVHACTSDFEITAHISYGDFDKTLRMKAYLPFKEGAVIALLELSGKMDFLSGIGITSLNESTVYVIKNTVLFSNGIEARLPSHIIRFLSETKKATRIVSGG